MGWLIWVAHRVLSRVGEAAEDLKRLTVLLTVPVNAMFEDVQKGLIKLTPEGEAAKSIMQEKQGNLMSSSQMDAQSL